eukprot:scaffold77807_cov27-Tisochrysis_lutea.AAC.1
MSVASRRSSWTLAMESIAGGRGAGAPVEPAVVAVGDGRRPWTLLGTRAAERKTTERERRRGSREREGGADGIYKVRVDEETKFGPFVEREGEEEGGTKNDDVQRVFYSYTRVGMHL